MIRLMLNGRETTLDVDPDMPLLWALRDHAGLTGTKYGCGIAQCGACTVHLDGQPIRACVTPASAVEGAAITTIEGIAGPVAEAVRAAWRDLDVVQCGYCQSGQIMAAVGLLSQTPSPTEDDVVAAMEGNLCRCGTYQRIHAAIADAATRLG
ncbi:(2Fe-2S)-binding protein [Salinarimonas rosea]|uniref:(2Fe-2S)-binding protein n=1 Tax=Salinarimonas rosea TaxID=552063 RepID=UPI0003FAA329|nr:(2Fe-2S)-binding protein [Salinarimonas rosea]